MLFITALVFHLYWPNRWIIQRLAKSNFLSKMGKISQNMDLGYRGVGIDCINIGLYIMKQVLITILLLLFCNACTTVKPWERDILAQDRMKLIQFPLENALDEHIFFSKEASSGGQGVGGGGCGCN